MVLVEESIIVIDAGCEEVSSVMVGPFVIVVSGSGPRVGYGRGMRD